MFRPILAGALACLTTACSTSYSGDDAVVLAEPVVAEAAPVATAPQAIIVPPPVPPSRAYRPARRGVITAGDIDDTLNLAAFQHYVGRTAKSLGVPRANFSNPVRVQMLDPDGRPAPGLRVTMRKRGAAEPFWSGYSGVGGMITVFPALHGAGRPSEVEMRTLTATGYEQAHMISTKGSRVPVQVSQPSSWKPDFLDIAIVIDTTGSMQDEIDWITKELKGFANTALRAAPGVDIRYGLVSYKAPGDYPPVQSFGFTKNLGQMRSWLKSLNAHGGAGGDEVVARGLEAGVAMNWRRGKGERLLIQIGDEPPSRNRTKAYLNAARVAAQKGIHVYGLGASGVEEHLEYLMRSAAAQTQGRYLFLTDDSGVGLAHAEPAISCYRVTRLTRLMNRILRSELTGKRLEARPNEVTRTVGSYQNGRCLN